MARTIGTASYGLRAPIVKQGDDLIQIVVDTVLNSGIEIKDKDVLGITESIVARCEGNYVTIDEVAEEINNKLVNYNGEEYEFFYYKNGRILKEKSTIKKIDAFNKLLLLNNNVTIKLKDLIGIK